MSLISKSCLKAQEIPRSWETIKTYLSVQIPSAAACFSCHLGCKGHQKAHKPSFSITISPEAFSSVVPHGVWMTWSNFSKFHQQNSSPLCFEDQKTVTDTIIPIFHVSTFSIFTLYFKMMANSSLDNSSCSIYDFYFIPSYLRSSNLTNCITFICSLMTLWLTCWYNRVKLETTSVGFRGWSFMWGCWWIQVLSAKFESKIFSGPMLPQALSDFSSPELNSETCQSVMNFETINKYEWDHLIKHPILPSPHPAHEYCSIKTWHFNHSRGTADMKDHLNGINVNEHFHSQTLNVLCVWLNLGHVWDRYKYH